MAGIHKNVSGDQSSGVSLKVFFASLFLSSSALVVGSLPAMAEGSGILGIGDAVITSFPGVVEPQEEPPEGQSILDETFINPEGISARITPLSAPAYLWDARVWPAETYRDFKAKDVGQVFGVTLDDAEQPNIYLAAGSTYGLHIVAPDADTDGRPERMKTGGASAEWMNGMWGANGGPGSIWKVDGKTGAVSLFADVRFESQFNAGAALGNITYVPSRKEIFVSDLSTGMIHRFDMNGAELEIFDHGVTGRGAANLSAVAYDAANRLDITSKDFDSEDPETWGFTEEDRRVWGLAHHGERLYYAVVGGSQIWSVGFDKDTGNFLSDARWEIDVPKKPKNLPVSDIAFTADGAMLLAQRGAHVSTYDYANFADTGKSRTYRYVLENPDDTKTPSRWIAEPEEYAVGFEPDHRATDGGIALGHGYTKDGFINVNVCEASLWSTGDNLRQNDDLKKALLAGGPQTIDGVQGMPLGPVKKDPPNLNNTPPWASYMLDVDPTNTDQSLETDDPLLWSDITTTGWMGDIAIRRGCTGGGAIADGGQTWPTEWPWDVDGQCTPGVNCPPPPPVCLRTTGKLNCDEKTGQWTVNLSSTMSAGFKGDSIKILATSPGISVAGGPVISMSATGSANFGLGGFTPGQLISIPICAFDKTEMASGKPFDCCKTTVTLQAPNQSCVKK
jgi:hypothetical protein